MSDLHLDRFSQGTPSDQLLAISSNLRRVATWSYDDNTAARLGTVTTFVNESDGFLNHLAADKKAYTVKDLFDRGVKARLSRYNSLPSRQQLSEYALTLSAICLHRANAEVNNPDPSYKII